ncbi:MAG: response regulator [Bacteroidetes bacterium]|nr:response regulator [Bacteroidota bacterium]
MPAPKLNTVILIDDDDVHNIMLSQYLRDRYKLEVHTFVSGDEALKKMDEINPAYVVLDYYLDKVDKQARNGLEILKSIKEQFPHIFVVMLSGQEKIEVAVDTMRFGAYDYIVKNPSGFVRVENVMKNIRHNIQLQKTATAYRYATIFLSCVIGLIIVGAILLRVLGLSTDNAGW